MKIALCWASPENPPGSATQAIRGHTTGLQANNIHVDLYYDELLNELPERQDEYRAVIWPSNLFNAYQIKALEDVHRHFHLIGVDMPSNETAFQEALYEADSISCVDPNCAYFFSQRFDLELSDITLIPNSPNLDVFPQYEPTNGGYVFSPKTGAAQKQGHSLIDIAEVCPNSVFETHTASPDVLAPVPFNVNVKPPVSWSQMPPRYKDSSFVLNVAQNEGLPNVCFEAFCSNRLYVSIESSIGRVQTVHKNNLSDLAFGIDMQTFHDKYNEYYRTGEHYITGQSVDDLVEVTRELRRNRGYRDLVASEGREWVEEFGELWSWKDVSKTMLEVIQE